MSTTGDSFEVFLNVPSAFIGMDSAGNAVVGWSRLNDGSAQANIFDATPPTLVANVPAGATAGQPSSFSASAGDLFSDVGAVTWSFGDGSTATGTSPTHIYATPGIYTVTTTATDAVGNASSVSHQITVASAPIVACAVAASAASAGCAPSPPPLRKIIVCLVPSLKGLTATVGLIEPGAVATELVGHNRLEVLQALASRPGLGSPMEARDIADAILYMVTRPRHVAVNEILIRPTDQER